MKRSWLARPGLPARIRLGAALLTLSAVLPLTAALTITPVPGTILPQGTVGTAITAITFVETGGVVPINWTVSPTSLPLGLTFTSSGTTASLSGTPQGCSQWWSGNQPIQCPNPTEPITSTFSVQVQDSSGPPQTLLAPYTMEVYWNPTQAVYTTTQNANFSAMAAQAGFSLPPAMLGGGHLIIANPLYRNSAYDNQAAWNAWVDAMKAAGMHMVNIEVDLECLLSNRPSCLGLYAQAIAHAHQLGMTVSLNPAYYSATFSGATSCGDAGCQNGLLGGMAQACHNILGYAINNGLPVGIYGSGVSDWYTCVAGYTIPGLGASAYQYMLVNWLQSGDRFVPVHEPTTQATHWGEGIALTGCSTGPGSMTTLTCNGTSGSPGVTNNTCPLDWLSNFIGMFFSALGGWGVPSGIIYGVTVNSSEMQGAAAFNYAYSFAQSLASITPTPPSIGMDIYSFGSTDQSLYVRTIANTHHFGEKAFVEEFGPQAWTLYGGQTGGACAIT